MFNYRICQFQLHCICCQLPADQRLEFHLAYSPHPSPSPSVDLCSICALVQFFYCFLCTSQNSLSLAEHNCALVKVSFHWLLRFSALVVNYSIRVTCHVLRRNLFVETKIVYWLISVPCIESFPRLPTQLSFGLLKASGSQIYCSSSLCRKKPLESSCLGLEHCEGSEGRNVLVSV